MTNDENTHVPGHRLTTICLGDTVPEALREVVAAAVAGSASLAGDDVSVVLVPPHTAQVVASADVQVVPREGGDTDIGAAGTAAARSGAELVAFWRADRSPGEAWLAQAVAALEADPALAAVGAHPDGTSPSRSAVLAVLFDGLVIRRATFVQAGGFDVNLGIEGATLDLCWRLAILGHRVRALGPPLGAVTPPPAVERSVARLVSAAKNLGEEAFPLVLAGAIAEEVRGSIARAGIDATALDLQRSPGGDDVGTVALSSAGLDGARAVESFINLLPALAAGRAELALARRVPDRAVFPLLRHELETGWLAGEPVPGVADVREALGTDDLLDQPVRVALLLADRPGDGVPARVRTLEGLLAGAGLALEVAPPEATSVDREALAYWADVVVLEGGLLLDAVWLPGLPGRVVVLDLDQPAVTTPAEVLAAALGRADILVCGSEDDRDFWLGALAGMERINAAVYDEDASLDSLALVVPGDAPADLAALVAFCRNPRRAADVTSGRPLRSVGAQGRPPRPSAMALVKEYHEAGGVPEVVRRARGRVAKKLRRSR